MFAVTCNSKKERSVDGRWGFHANGRFWEFGVTIKVADVPKGMRALTNVFEIVEDIDISISTQVEDTAAETEVTETEVPDEAPKSRRSKK